MYWLAWWTRNDLLQTLTTNKSTISASQQRILLDSIQYLQEHEDIKNKELTEHEVKIFDGWDLILPLVINIFFNAKSPHASRDLKKSFALVLDFVNATRLAFISLEPPVLPDWAYYHNRFLHLELFKAYNKLCDGVIVVSKQKAHHAYGKIPIEVVLSIKKESRVTGTLLQSQAKELKQGLEKNGSAVILGLLKTGEHGVGAAIEDLLRADTVKDHTKKFLESVIESLNGILKVNV
jgi:hypothetical protein